MKRVNNLKVLDFPSQTNNESNLAKILIADDDAAMNGLLRFILKTEFKGEIISVFDGKEAVEKCLAYQPDIVFMDLMMPIKDGITAIRELRESGFTNPIIVITANHAMISDNCYKSGANYVIRKPFNKDLILDQLRCNNVHKSEYTAVVSDEYSIYPGK